MKLELRFSRRQGDFALSVDATITGRFTAVCGPSGCGKTTVLDCVGGMRTPDEGEIVLDGAAFFSTIKKINLPLERRHIGYVHQGLLLFPHLSLARNLDYGRRRRPGPITLDHVVKILELDGLLRLKPHQVSGGQAQRAALGRALCSNPRLLLVDEPLVSLDRVIRRKIVEYLEKVKNEFAVPMIYVTHEAEEIRHLADEMLILERGRIVAQGTPNEVFEKIPR
jgi:molybdate transport system ATP-binding protein